MIKYVYTFESDLLSYSKEMYCKRKCVNRDIIVARDQRDEDRSELRRSSSDAAYHGNPLLEFFAFPCRSDGGNTVTTGHGVCVGAQDLYLTKPDGLITQKPRN